eukprot:CAMPEP_0204157724 /NCGR_PEP_ID=MMETSP0361-20130328/31482_1 /ASSEMBLY_ACC=CAM_ASM_000343 /TAXON_ID=268821 /ORGANISM="Scrippsiella Hangoei, Strain SHTV-5" /LENGTH=259 /DNA_ID=CAMNT_0051113547 /DNA_START=333 /DNA_END=1114 /DNA_ORIENTATION=+
MWAVPAAVRGPSVGGFELSLHWAHRGSTRCAKSPRAIHVELHHNKALRALPLSPGLTVAIHHCDLRLPGGLALHDGLQVDSRLFRLPLDQHCQTMMKLTFATIPQPSRQLARPIEGCKSPQVPRCGHLQVAPEVPTLRPEQSLQHHIKFHHVPPTVAGAPAGAAGSDIIDGNIETIVCAGAADRVEDEVTSTAATVPGCVTAATAQNFNARVATSKEEPTLLETVTGVPHETVADDGVAKTVSSGSQEARAAPGPGAKT